MGGPGYYPVHWFSPLFVSPLDVCASTSQLLRLSKKCWVRHSERVSIKKISLSRAFLNTRTFQTASFDKVAFTASSTTCSTTDSAKNNATSSTTASTPASTTSIRTESTSTATQLRPGQVLSATPIAPFHRPAFQAHPMPVCKRTFRIGRHPCANVDGKSGAEGKSERGSRPHGSARHIISNFGLLPISLAQREAYNSEPQSSAWRPPNGPVLAPPAGRGPCDAVDFNLTARPATDVDTAEIRSSAAAYGATAAVANAGALRPSLGRWHGVVATLVRVRAREMLARCSEANPSGDLGVLMDCSAVLQYRVTPSIMVVPGNKSVSTIAGGRATRLQGKPLSGSGVIGVTADTDCPRETQVFGGCWAHRFA